MFVNESFLNFWLFLETFSIYSYLNASIGFICAALLAGKYPKNRPIPIENPIEITIPLIDGIAGYPIQFDNITPAVIPKINPNIPPIRHIIIASTINCARIDEFFASRQGFFFQTTWVIQQCHLSEASSSPLLSLWASDYSSDTSQQIKLHR